MPRPVAALEPGTYTKVGFKPTLIFTIGSGWTAAQAAGGFFDIEDDPGSPDVVTVQFANVSADSLVAAIEDVTSRPNTQVIDKGDETISGLSTFSAVIETTDPADSDPPIFRPVVDVAAGPISIASGRRLKVMLLQVPGGVLGILIGGSTAQWQHALDLATPVVESVSIGN